MDEPQEVEGTGYYNHRLDEIEFIPGCSPDDDIFEVPRQYFNLYAASLVPKAQREAEREAMRDAAATLSTTLLALDAIMETAGEQSSVAQDNQLGWASWCEAYDNGHIVLAKLRALPGMEAKGG